MLSSISPMMLAQSANPMMTTCGAVRSTFRDNSCCTATLGNSIPVPSACPTLDELVTFPKQMGNVRRAPLTAVVPRPRLRRCPRLPAPTRWFRCHIASTDPFRMPPSAVDAVPD